MIVKTEAVVLRSMKYRDTSRIVTFYTKQFGKISGIVKGARTTKQPFGSTLQPMSYVNIVLYKKEGRDLHTVSQCDLEKSFRSLGEDLGKMAVGMAIIELVANIAHEEEENVPLFELLLDSLSSTNDTDRAPTEQLMAFEIRLARILGFKPVFDACVSCGKRVPATDAEIRFELERGGPLCSKCLVHHGQTVLLRGRLLQYLASLDRAAEEEQSPPIDLDEASTHDIEHLLGAFLKKHVTGIRTSNTGRVFSQILSHS